MMQMKVMRTVKTMRKFMRAIGNIFIAIYRIIDKLIVTPISKLVYNFNTIIKGSNFSLEKVLNKMTDFVLKELSTERPHNLSIYQFVVLLTHEELKAKGIVAMDLSFFTEPITRVLKKIEAERNEK